MNITMSGWSKILPREVGVSSGFRLRGGPCLLLSIVLTMGAAPAVAAGGAAPGLIVRADGPERLLFDHERDACEVWDVPDAPARAYRDADGKVHLFQTHFHNRALVGDDFASLKHSCNIVFQGAESSDAAQYSDRSWITSTYTFDGRTVYGLVHNEFQANRWPELCPSREYMKCWYNSVTSIVSTDGGATFRYNEPRLVAAIPFTAKAAQGHHAGFFIPSNIVHRDGYYYFLSSVAAPAPQASGNCLFRTRDITDNKSWRMWRKGAFETRVADPYVETVDPADHLCDPVGGAALRWPVNGVVFHEPSHTWIAIMLGRTPDAEGNEITGFHYATSPDLVNWSGPWPVQGGPTSNKRDCSSGRTFAYPSLIDPESRSRNFETVGSRAELYFSSLELQKCRMTTRRDLRSLPVRIDMR